MILYHGSYTQIKNPKILFQEKGRDFGFGFYTTSIKEQAERWTIRLARLYSKQTEKEEIAIVNIYEFDDKLARNLKIKTFARPDLDWLDFVVRCRSDLEFRHGFDIVSGKIADDKVGETVEYVLAGIMRKEDAAEHLKFEKINDQTCFCTDEALKALHFKESYEIQKISWK